MLFPYRRTEPEFYEVVSDPIDMLRIQQKLKMDEYTELKGLKEDFELLFKNALSYYKKGSQEFKDATEMSELFHKAFGKSGLKKKLKNIRICCSTVLRNGGKCNLGRSHRYQIKYCYT